MPDGALFPLEVNQYDDWVFREALHNCIAHQDYSLCARISVVEFPDHLVFHNRGTFIPQSIERVINRDAPESRYRNPFLAAAMVNLNMIDTVGSGIKRMFLEQRKRFFPLPEYTLDESGVTVSILGKVLDPRYVQLLASDPDLGLHDVILLDSVQKGKRISREDARRLRARHLIEGRYPKFHVAASVAALSKQKARYIHYRGLDEEYYAELVLRHIEEFGAITRPEADELLLQKLPDLLDSKQKKNKVHRLLSAVLKGRIENVGSRRKPRYVLMQEDTREEERSR